MTIPQAIAKNLREVFDGGNWTAVDIKAQIEGVSWEEANREVHGFNTIVGLMYHIIYYMRSAIGVLKGGPLEGSDRFSFDHPPIESQGDWEAFIAEIWRDMETCANLIEQMPEEQLWTDLETYGSYYRNLQGLVEHAHYHLGQIVLIRKIIRRA